jgi:predicted enzyme related to lactoylglutathione lyase
MRIREQITVFDAPDLAAESTFWAGVLGGTVDEAADDWHTILVEGRRRLAVQLAPDLVRPDWPHGQPQQLHIDLTVDDIRTSHDEVMALGARLLQPADDLDAAGGWQVYADPAGHPFCLCW